MLDYQIDSQAFVVLPLSNLHYLFVRRLNTIPYNRLKYIHIYIFQRFELNAIATHTRLAKFFSIRLCSSTFI